MKTTLPQPRSNQRRLWVALAVVITGLVLLVGVLIPATTSPLRGAPTGTGAGRQLMTLALPAFLAGVVSFLSPCTLPILPGYFAFTFGARRQQVALMTVAFFLGLATTLTILGAGVSFLGSLFHGFRDQLTVIGGVLIVGLGCMSLVGKGFTGIKMNDRPATTFTGTYLFGMTFALGWTACVGPILGALLTLVAAQGSSGAVLAGAVLAFLYALGLALPLFLITLFFSRLGTGTQAWRFLKGRGWEVKLFGRTLYLHSTSVISGLLLIGVGLLLATGQLGRVSGVAAPGVDVGADLQSWIARVFGLDR